MNKLFTIIVLYTGLIILPASADELPEEAKRELEKLEDIIQDLERDTEKQIIRKKESTIRSLERTERKSENYLVKNLIKIQLTKYLREIKESEERLEGKNEKVKSKNKNIDMREQAEEASRIIDFEQSYFYNHPVNELKGEVGEFKFYPSGKVKCYHRSDLKVLMSKTWKWSMMGDNLVIYADSHYGPIYVTKLSPKEIRLDWRGQVNKKNVAKRN